MRECGFESLRDQQTTSAVVRGYAGQRLGRSQELAVSLVVQLHGSSPILKQRRGQRHAGLPLEAEEGRPTKREQTLLLLRRKVPVL